MGNYLLNRTDKSFDVIMSSEGKVSASDSYIETDGLCGACLERSGTQFCVNCDVVLCRTCTKSHKRLGATKNHILTDIPESDRNDHALDKKPTIPCSQYSFCDKTAHCFCCECEKTICEDHLQDHKGHKVTSKLHDAEVLRKIGVTTISKLYHTQKEIDTIKESRTAFSEVSIKQHTLTKTRLEKMRKVVNCAVDKLQMQQDVHIKYLQEGHAHWLTEANYFVDMTENLIPELNSLRHAKNPDNITKTTTQCKQLLTSMETWTEVAAIEAGKQTVEDYFPDMEYIMQELQQHISNISIKPNYKMQRLQRRVIIENFGRNIEVCQSSQDEGDNLVLYADDGKMVRIYSLNDITSFTEHICPITAENMVSPSSNRYVIQECGSSILHLCDSNFQTLKSVPPTGRNTVTRVGPDYGRNGFIKCEGFRGKKGITVYRVDTNNDNMVQQLIGKMDDICLMENEYAGDDSSFLFMSDNLLTLIYYQRAYRFDVKTSVVKEQFFKEICTEEDLYNAYVDRYNNVLVCDDSFQMHLYKDQGYSVVQRLHGHGATGITVRNGCLILCCACAGCRFGYNNDPFTLEIYC